MDETYERLVETVFSLLSEIPLEQRLIIAVAGSPGSGKSTITEHLCELINKEHANLSVVVPQDGFHLYRSELMKLPDPVEALKRRGAPFTFDSAMLLRLVKELKKPVTKIIKAPNFNHVLKDPTLDSIIIKPENRVILLEGNYLLLKLPIWSDIASIVDCKWFVKVADDTARKRIIKRHLQSGICDNFEDLVSRCENNDMVNSEFIKLNSCKPDLIIESIDC